MAIRLSQCFIPTLDHEKAISFYRDALGLEVRNDVRFEDVRWVTVSSRSDPDIEIVLETPGANPDASAEDRRVLEALTARGLMARIVFATDDCDAVFEQMQRSGSEVVQEPNDQPYGVRDCAFRDPSGNLLRFSQQIRR